MRDTNRIEDRKTRSHQGDSDRAVNRMGKRSSEESVTNETLKIATDINAIRRNTGEE